MCELRYNTATSGTDNEPANQVPSSVAAWPAAAKMASVAWACDADVAPEKADMLLSRAGGADESGVMVVSIFGIALMVLGKSKVGSNDTVGASDRVAAV